MHVDFSAHKILTRLTEVLGGRSRLQPAAAFLSLRVAIGGSTERAMVPAALGHILDWEGILAGSLKQNQKRANPRHRNELLALHPVGPVDLGDLMLLQSVRAVLILSLILPSTRAAFAESADGRLVRLIPADSQIVADMQSRSRNDHLDSFVLITRGNKIDLQDFYAIVGADTSRTIREVVFAAANGNSGILDEHSLLASGHFSRDAIYKMVDGGKASRVSYRGVPVLVVLAFEREAGMLDQLRWLAVVDEETALFGTVESVRRELDRWVAGAAPDPTLTERLSHLGKEDESWCLLSAHFSAGLAGALGKLDPKFKALAKEKRPLTYGIHFGSRIEVTVSSNSPSRTELQAPDNMAEADSKMAPGLLSRSNAMDDRERYVAKISRSKYAQWVAGYANGLSIDVKKVP